MRITLARAQARYQIDFFAPSLEVITSSIALLSTLQDRLSLETKLQAADLSINAGGNVSDFRIQVRLPFLNGNVEVTASHVAAQFGPLTQHVQLASASRCIQLSDAAIWGLLKTTRPAGSTFRLIFWFRVPNGRDEVKRYLQELNQPGAQLQKRLREHIAIEAKTTKLDFADKGNAWSASVVLEESAIPEADLFGDLTVSFPSAEDHGSIETRLERFGSVMKDLAVALDLDEVMPEPRPN